MANPVFRPVALADVPTILGLMREYYAYDGLQFDQVRAAETLARLVQDPTAGRVFLIQYRDVPAGYLALTFGYSLEFHGKDAFVDELFIVESLRGQGIGRETLSFAESTCRDLGVGSLHLGVEKSNRSARAFYEKVGYPDVGRSLLSKRLL